MFKLCCSFLFLLLSTCSAYAEGGSMRGLFDDGTKADIHFKYEREEHWLMIYKKDHQLRMQLDHPITGHNAVSGALIAGNDTHHYCFPTSGYTSVSDFFAKIEDKKQEHTSSVYELKCTFCKQHQSSGEVVLSSEKLSMAQLQAIMILQNSKVYK